MQLDLSIPWLKASGDVPVHLNYFQGTMCEKVEEIASTYPKNIAMDFMGKRITYKVLTENIYKIAKALKAIGIKENENITIAMPNCPQAIFLFYAVNMIGAISNMVHPLSAEKEIEFYLNESNSSTFITLDQFFNKFKGACDRAKVQKIIVTSIKDELPKYIKPFYSITVGKGIPHIESSGNVYNWNDLLKNVDAYNGEVRAKRSKDDVAVILYSGGTTGVTKGIALTNYNFNALTAQIVAANPMFVVGDKMLAAMPIFHGFGLGVCIHSMLANGGRCVLVPRFTPESYSKLIVKYKVNFMAGVPTLFEALLRIKKMIHADLSCLKGVFSGGDSLSIELKKKFDTFLKEHKSTIQIREGYGATECVTASCLTPTTVAKEGSIGIPLPDTYYKIVEPGTENELPYGTEGEIVLAGPTVMKEYVNHPEETKDTLKVHKDGHTWLYTGDLGIMDEEGYIYFKGRIKRMIISSGYNIYPAQLENIIDAHEAVQMSCIIGIPDDYKMHKVKAFVMLRKGYTWSEELKQDILQYCKKHIAKFAMPYDIEYREILPKTLVGKVAYRQLEEEELDKLKNNK